MASLQIDDPKLLELLQQPLPQPEKQVRTLFDISGFPRWETVTSNWYAYFLTSAEDHTLSDLFIQSLMEVIQVRQPEFAWPAKEVFAQTEYQTKKGNSIDIVVSDAEDLRQANRAVIIELKIDAGVYNDLTDYYDSVEVGAKAGVLLTLKPTEPADGRFLNITHADWQAALRKRLGEYLLKADSRSLLLLQEFLNNLKNMFDPATNPDGLHLLVKYGPQIHQLAEFKKEAEADLGKSIQQAATEAGWVSMPKQSNGYVFRYQDLPYRIYVWIDKLFATGSLRINCWIHGTTWTSAWNEWYYEDSDWEPFAALAKHLPLREGDAGKEWFMLTDEKSYPNILSTHQDYPQIAAKVVDILAQEWRPVLLSLHEALKKRVVLTS